MLMKDASEDLIAKRKRHRKHPQSLAVVFDIDETLIGENRKRIEPVCMLYDLCLTLNLSPFIVTAREESSREATYRELEENGIRDYIGAYFRDAHEYNVARQKKEARKDIQDQGYEVIMSVGDMEWDVGKYGGIPVLLPRMAEGI